MLDSGLAYDSCSAIMSKGSDVCSLAENWTYRRHFSRRVFFIFKKSFFVYVLMIITKICKNLICFDIFDIF